MVPVTPYDNAKKGAQHQGRRTRSATPKPSTKERTQYVVPSTSARKTSQRKQQKGAAAPQPSPPKDIAQQGGLYFDMDGRPMFVEMKPAAFYGESLMRPFIKLDEENKPVKDRPFQPKLPNEPLIEWGKQTKWEKGGMRQPPLNASQLSLQKRAQEMKDPLPPKPRAAWQFYAEELIQKATNARDRLEGDDVAVRQLITDEVRGLGKKRHRWVVPHAEEHLGEAGKGGKWAQLSAVDQEKYIKMHNEDVKRYDHQMEAWNRKHPEQHSKAVEQCIQRIAARKAQEVREAQLQQQPQQQGGQEVQEGEEQQQQDEQQQQQGEIALGEAERGSKRQRVGGKKAKETGRKGAGQQRKQLKGKKTRKGEQEEEEAEEGQSDEEDEVYQSEASESEDHLDPESKHEEDDENEQQPRKKQEKVSSPGRKVLANAASKLNTPPKGGKGTVSKLSPTKIGGVVTKKPASRTSPAKLGGVVASSTRASVHSK